MLVPNVILPEGFDAEAKVEEYGADVGVCSCPKCKEFYCLVGSAIRCSKCEFEFPTTWWSDYSAGCSDGTRIAKGGEVSGGMKIRCQRSVYYDFGFRFPVEEAWKAKDIIDWEKVVADDPRRLSVIGHGITSCCERCGEEKEGRRARSSQLCIQCEHETSCQHRKKGDVRSRSDGTNEVCEAGVRLGDLTGDEPGWGLRRPCSYWPGGCPVACEKFEPLPIEELLDRDEDDEMNGDYLCESCQIHAI